MIGIHDAVTSYIKTALERDLISGVAEKPAVKNSTTAGIVIRGPLQGDPDPDVARISVEVYENDPDQETTGSGIGQSPTSWQDKILEVECGGSLTWARYFTVKIRCLLDLTREGLDEARRVASAVRTRAESSILSMSFYGVHADTGEYVSRGAFGDEFITEMRQSGGPPDSYDFQIKIRFAIWTTTRLVVGHTE